MDRQAQSCQQAQTSGGVVAAVLALKRITTTLVLLVLAGIGSSALLGPAVQDSLAAASTCAGLAPTVTGSDASETVYGTAGDDVILALAATTSSSVSAAMM
jgi:hypothetical protein